MLIATVGHLSDMTELNKQGRYDRMTEVVGKLTGEVPMNMREFVKLHAAEFKQGDPAHSWALSTSRKR